MRQQLIEAGQAARVLNIGSQPALAGAYLNGYRVNGAVRRPAVFLCQFADGVVTVSYTHLTLPTT